MGYEIGNPVAFPDKNKHFWGKTTTRVDYTRRAMVAPLGAYCVEPLKNVMQSRQGTEMIGLIILV